MAGIAAGKTFGVARSAGLIDVRVYDKDNKVQWSSLLAGLDYVAGEQEEAANGGKTIIVNTLIHMCADSVALTLKNRVCRSVKQTSI